MLIFTLRTASNGRWMRRGEVKKRVSCGVLPLRERDAESVFFEGGIAD